MSETGSGRVPAVPTAQRRGVTLLLMGASALVVAVPLLLIGPRAGLIGVWAGGMVGVVIALIGLVAGLVRFVGGQATTFPMKLWQAVAVGAGVPALIALAMEGIAATAF